MRRAVFRVDASPAIGGGHVVRCLALADALGEAGWACMFLVGAGTRETVPALARSPFVVLEGDGWRDPAPDLLVVDHYRLDAEWESGWRDLVPAILVIDDLADRRHRCDLLVDATWGRGEADYAGLVPPGCRLLLGPDHALLRPQFVRRRAEALARRRTAALARVLIAPGATDPTDLASGLIDAALRLPDVAIDVAIGSAAPHLPGLRRRAAGSARLFLHVDTPDMAGLMIAADLCLGAAGGTSWERCCLGLPTILAVASADQSGVAAGLVAAGAALCVDAGNRAALADALDRLARDAALRRRIGRAAAALCDGEGVSRVVAAIG
jgi:UDP-2,4-diacetamido-2,4,6-trideoxy-beta-L-altropyranose hydrolase